MKLVLALIGILANVHVYGTVSLNLQKYSLTLTTQTNLEKMFFIEEELITIFSIFLREEFFHHGVKDGHIDDDEGDNHVHITELKQNQELIEDAKRVHKLVGLSSSLYLKHPINVYHMMRRMRRWDDAIKVLSKSKPCQSWNMPEVTSRLVNMKKGLPTQDNFENVAYDLVILKHVHDLKTGDLFAGNVFNHSSLDPMSPRDIYDIARIAYKRDDFYYAATWAKYLTMMFIEYDIQHETYDFSVKNLFAILSSSYYQLKQYKNALFASEMILKLDPDSRLAQANKKFFETQVEKDTHQPLKRVHPGDRIRRKYEALCRGDLKKPSRISKQYYCKYQKTKKMFVYEKMEVLNFSPKILQFYNIFDYDSGAAIRYLGYKPLSDSTYGGTKFQTPHFTSIPTDKTRSQWVRKLNARLDSLPMTSIRPYRRGQMEIRNIGLEGLYYDIKDAKHWAPRINGGHTASMFAFLNEVEAGGEIVFPFNRVRVTPTLGSVVYFFPSRTFMMVCPVGYDTEWLSVVSYYEATSTIFCRDHDQ